MMKRIIALVLIFCFVFLFAAESFAAKPVIKKQPETATTSSDGTVVFSITASGDATSYSWFFVNPKTGSKISGKKLPKRVKGVKVTGPNRPKITLKRVPESMHGWLVYCVVKDSGGHKVDSEYATLLVHGMEPPESESVAEFKITTQPKSAGISSKGTLTFTVKYSGLAEKITWAFINPKDGKKVIGKNILKTFKNMTASGINKSKLTLSNVPEGMVGWKVYAHLKGKGFEINTDTVTVLSAEEVAAAKKAEKQKAAEEESKAAEGKAKAAEGKAEAAKEENKTITVTCSEKLMRPLNNNNLPIGDEPASQLVFTDSGAFIVSSDKPIKSWIINGLTNQPDNPVTEFKVTNVTSDLSLTLIFE